VPFDGSAISQERPLHFGRGDTERGGAMRLCVLISAFCLLTSVGLGDDISLDTIAGIPCNVDSGQSIVPCPVLSTSTGGGPGEVYLEILRQGIPVCLDSAEFMYLPARTSCTLAFNGGVPRGRDSMEAVAWLNCPGDTNPENDTCRVRFFVRIKDLGLSDLWPSGDTFDSGQVIVPHVRASNLGNVPLSFGLWRDSVYLPPGEDTILYGDTIVCMPGIWTVSAFVVIVGDLHPENNLIVDTFCVRGTMFESLWVRVLMPDTVDTGETITPRVWAGNCGINPAALWLQFNIYDSAGRALLPVDSIQMILNPGDSTETEYGPISFSGPGMFIAVAMACFNSEHPVADSHYFWVVPGVGVEESPRPQASSHKLQATVVRALPAGAVSFDAMGRRLLNPRPGVYFIREYSAFSSQHSGRSAVSVRKVVLQR
jgi:hypothetical protein